MRKAILMMLLAMASGNAAAEWVKVAETHRSVIYVNPASIRKVGHIVKMWSLADTQDSPNRA